MADNGFEEGTEDSLTNYRRMRVHTCVRACMCVPYLI